MYLDAVFNNVSYFPLKSFEILNCVGVVMLSWHYCEILNSSLKGCLKIGIFMINIFMN